MNDKGLVIPDHIRRQIVEFNALRNVVLNDSSFDLPTNDNVNDVDDSENYNDQDNDVQVQIELNNLLRTSNVDGEHVLDDDDVRIVWNDDHDWFVSKFIYANSTEYYSNLFTSYKNNAISGSAHVIHQEVSRDALLSEQVVAHDLFVHSVVDQNFQGGLFCMYGMGGSGKSFVIDAIRSTLRNVHRQEIIVRSFTG